VGSGEKEKTLKEGKKDEESSSKEKEGHKKEVTEAS
jgi:hypothetical protein